MRISRTLFLLVPMLLWVSAEATAQLELFVRKATIDLPAAECAGFGNIVSGVDFDGDGKVEIYAVNNNWNDAGPCELIPRIYKFELDGATWDTVWSAELGIPLQNTWPAITHGDWDKDGKMEIIWGPVNNTNAVTNPNPPRIVVFETPGDGSDNMGVSDGAGGWRPNAMYTITDIDNDNERPFLWLLNDVDFDGDEEIVFGSRAGDIRFGVVSVDDIPDAGDSTETWTLEASGDDTTFTIDGGTIYDLAIVDSTVYLIHSNGNVTIVKYAAGVWTTPAIVTSAVPGGSWKSASAVDLDGNGSMEIVVAGWSGADVENNIYLLEPNDTSLTTTMIADIDTLIGGARIYGGTAGDVDNDGYMDFVFGTRDATPNAAIVLVRYNGGAITSESSYDVEIIDSELAAGGRWDVFNIVNMDADADLEIVYTEGTGGSNAPIAVVDRVVLDPAPEPIADVRVDMNGDYLPDRDGDTVTVVGVVTSANFTASANRFSYYIQDETAGINITKGSEFGGGPVFMPGDQLVATGVLSQFAGGMQIGLSDLATDLLYLGAATPVTPEVVTIDEYLADAEMLEGSLIQINYVAKTEGSADWPDSGNYANMDIWDGAMELILRVDNDTDLDNNPEPTYPMNVVGIATQYTFADPPNDGYQITPSWYTSITQGVLAPPNPHFALHTPADGSTIVLNDTAQTVTFEWDAAVDLNGDALIYQWIPIGFTPKLTGNSGADTLLQFTGKEMLQYLGASDTTELKWTVAAKDPGPPVYNSDTVSVTLVRGLITGVDEGMGIPTEFALQQNYPNPFNPTTTIRFALPMQSTVTLRIYDVVGREVVKLVEGVQPAGYHEVNWNSSNASGVTLASGVYFYRLEAQPVDGGNAFIQLKKMMLLK